MKVHQITGVGPQNTETGNVYLFTVLKKPFDVTKEWLDAQSKYPGVGDDLVEAEDGTLTLATDTDVADEATAEATQKKTDGESSLETSSPPSTTGSSDGSEALPSALPAVPGMVVEQVYVANPVEVSAVRIVDASPPYIDEETNATKVNLALENGVNATLTMLQPVAGAYAMRLPDGSQVWVPKELFETFFSPK